jgi:lipoprotein NlpI
MILLLLLLQAAEGHPLSEEAREKIRRDAQAVVSKADGSLSERGDAYFNLGKFPEAAAAYDKMLQLDPSLEKSHWRRGIAFFYAGEYEKAAKQFEVYDTFDHVDRENGIWRYFSQVKAFGKEKARAGLLKYAKDDREPFPDVYQLFEGKRTPEQILEKIKAAPISDEDREQRYFYAHLYIGLNHAVENRPDEARPYLRKAVENTWGPSAGTGPRYMWHVGRVQYDLLKKS